MHCSARRMVIENFIASEVKYFHGCLVCIGAFENLCRLETEAQGEDSVPALSRVCCLGTLATLSAHHVSNIHPDSRWIDCSVIVRFSRCANNPFPVQNCITEDICVIP